MKNIILSLFTIVFFVSTGNSQTIKWVSNSEFEEIVSNPSSKTFILIIDSSIDEKREDKATRRNNNYSFLEDSETVKFLNENFTCYKFDIGLSPSLTFNGVEYKTIKKGTKTSHEFVTFLAGTERIQIPSVVLKDKDFELYNYDRKEVNTEEIKILIEAEKIKLEFLSKKLDVKNKHSKRSSELIKKFQNDLSKSSTGKQSQSIIPVRGNNNFIKTLKYFNEDFYKTIDYQNYLIKKL
jgi:hypothetical protein